MKKSHSFDELSDKHCVKCDGRLKLRIAKEKPTANLCFNCHVEQQAGRSHFILGQKQSKRSATGEKPEVTRKRGHISTVFHG